MDVHDGVVLPLVTIHFLQTKHQSLSGEGPNPLPPGMTLHSGSTGEDSALSPDYPKEEGGPELRWGVGQPSEPGPGTALLTWSKCSPAMM